MKLQKFLISYFRFKVRLLSKISKKWAGNSAFKIFCTPYIKVQCREGFINTAEKILFKFRSIQTTGYHWNKGGSQKILIAHGFRSAAANFQHFAKKLIEKNYQVFAFDAPAHGHSNGRTLNAIMYQDFIRSVIQKFGPFDGFLTHSFGGLAVSMCLAEMGSNENIKTVLIAPAANSEKLIQFFFKEMHITDEKVQFHFLENIKRLSGQDIEWFSIKRCAPGINGEMLWVQDKYDKITPAGDAFEIEKLSLKNFHFLFTENLGHRRIYRDEMTIKTIVDFL